MEIIDDFNEIKEICKNKKVGWMIFEEKNHISSLNQGYINCLKKLKETNDIVIVDLLHFTMMLNVLWKNEYFIPNYFIELPDYIDYFKDYVDYLFFQDHPQQLSRITNSGFDIGKLKKEANGLFYDYKYKANELITKTFIMIFLIYKKFYNINITESANMWKCGYRSYYYRNFLKKLKIKMYLIDPLFDNDGLIITDGLGFKNNFIRTKMININNTIKNKNFNEDEIKQIKDIEEVYIFYYPQFSKHKITEVLIEDQGLKSRLVIKD